MVVPNTEVGIQDSPLNHFHAYHYQRHNHRRLEHLASLGLPIAGSTVLEVGAGVGDHTSFFLDRNCRVVSVEARPENLEILRTRYPDIEVSQLDLDSPEISFEQEFDIVYCYGLLYHLSKPAEAIEFLSRCCGKMLLLETCVSYGNAEAINLCHEAIEDPTQSFHGQGCRPTRTWVHTQLKRQFEFVYMPVTQPNHEEFPLDWGTPPSSPILTRSIYIASRQKLENPVLTESIPMQQKRH